MTESAVLDIALLEISRQVHTRSPRQALLIECIRTRYAEFWTVVRQHVKGIRDEHSKGLDGAAVLQDEITRMQHLLESRQDAAGTSLFSLSPFHCVCGKHYTIKLTLLLLLLLLLIFLFLLADTLTFRHGERPPYSHAADDSHTNGTAEGDGQGFEAAVCSGEGAAQEAENVQTTSCAA